MAPIIATHAVPCYYLTTIKFLLTNKSTFGMCILANDKQFANFAKVSPTRILRHKVIHTYNKIVYIFVDIVNTLGL